MAPRDQERPYESLPSNTPQLEIANPRSGLRLPLEINTADDDDGDCGPKTIDSPCGSRGIVFTLRGDGSGHSKSMSSAEYRSGLRRMSDPSVRALGPMDASASNTSNSWTIGCLDASSSSSGRNNTLNKVRLENFVARRARLKTSPGPDFAVPLGELPDLIDLCTPPSTPSNSDGASGRGDLLMPAPRTVSHLHRSSTGCIPENLVEENEEALVEDVPMYLEEMNASADDLNRAQEALKESEQRREEFITQWAVQKVFLVHKVGRNQVARARPHHERRLMLKEVRRKAELAAIAFLEASTAVEDRKRDLRETKTAVETRWLKTRLEHAESVLDEQQKTHAAQLLEYQRLQREHDEKWSKSWAMLEDAAPYFEAEDAYREELDVMTEKLNKCHDDVDEAKERYRGALKSLEDISRAVHAQRGNSELEKMSASRPASPQSRSAESGSTPTSGASTTCSPSTRPRTPPSRSATPVHGCSDHSPPKCFRPNGRSASKTNCNGSEAASATEALDLILAGDGPDNL